MDRALDFGSGGWGFDSLRARIATLSASAKYFYSGVYPEERSDEGRLRIAAKREPQKPNEMRATSSMVEQFPLKESVPGSSPGSLTVIFFLVCIRRENKEKL